MSHDLHTGEFGVVFDLQSRHEVWDVVNLRSGLFCGPVGWMVDGKIAIVLVEPMTGSRIADIGDLSWLLM